MLFKDRHDAGRRLAAALQAYRGKGALVMAVPRGGVIVAGPVAESLVAPLDVVIPRKVGLPGNPELAVAAVAPGGTVIYNERLMRTLNLQREELKPAVDREQVEIKRRLQAYRGQARQAELTGRIVIVVDDGIATGLTMEAALLSLRQARPDRLVLAIPVAPPDTLERLQSHVDHLICLAAPEPFYAVGQFYEDFGQVTDAEVKAVLAKFRKDN